MIPKYLENNINYVKLNFDYIVGSQKATSLKNSHPLSFLPSPKEIQKPSFKNATEIPGHDSWKLYRILTLKYQNRWQYLQSMLARDEKPAVRRLCILSLV